MFHYAIFVFFSLPFSFLTRQWNFLTSSKAMYVIVCPCHSMRTTARFQLQFVRNLVRCNDDFISVYQWLIFIIKIGDKQRLATNRVSFHSNHNLQQRHWRQLRVNRYWLYWYASFAKRSFQGLYASLVQWNLRRLVCFRSPAPNNFTVRSVASKFRAVQWLWRNAQVRF